MNITIDNFHKSQNFILNQADQCEFIAIDLEFSGINGELQCYSTDTPIEHYLKRKSVV